MSYHSAAVRLLLLALTASTPRVGFEVSCRSTLPCPVITTLGGGATLGYVTLHGLLCMTCTVLLTLPDEHSAAGGEAGTFHSRALMSVGIAIPTARWPTSTHDHPFWSMNRS